MPCNSANQYAETEQLQAELRTLARQIVSKLSALGSSQSKEVLSDFVSELFLGLAKQSQREERRRKQAEGIAAAQARGVHFGRPAPPLPDGFDECHRAWRSGEMTLLEAANACGMRKTTFENAALRKERFSSGAEDLRQ